MTDKQATLTDHRNEIWAFVRDHGPSTLTDIRRSIDLPPEGIRRLVWRMVEDRVLRRDGFGLYEVDPVTRELRRAILASGAPIEMDLTGPDPVRLRLLAAGLERAISDARADEHTHPYVLLDYIEHVAHRLIEAIPGPDPLDDVGEFLEWMRRQQ